MDKPEDVIGYWRAVELFTPNDIPKVDRLNPVRQTSLLDEGLPWGPQPLTRTVRVPKGHIVRHVVYLGVYPITAAYEALDRIFAPDDEGLDARPAGDSACAAIAVDRDGRAISETLALSGCAWAVGAVTAMRRKQRATVKDLSWIDGYEDADKDFHRAVGSLLARAAEAAGSQTGGVPLTIDTIREMGAIARGVLELTLPDPTRDEIRIETFTVPMAHADLNTHDFLNSFYVDDLGRAREAARSGLIGAGLRTYLRADSVLNHLERVDVRTNLTHVYSAIAPTNIPLGRWPSSAEQPAALSQQFAVNTLRTHLKDHSGLFSVNGPPGTGKTTMLRDVVASIVVDRADALASLESSRMAFSGFESWSSGGFQRSAPTWVPALRGHEVVVASSNNSAVENISDEIPDADVTDPTLMGGVDHFTEIATALLNQSDVVTETTRQAWGLIAARLGNKANRTKFLTHFFFDSASNRYREDDASDRLGMNTLLKRAAATAPSMSWSAAVSAYQRARGEVERLLDERQQAAERPDELTGLMSTIDELRRDIGQAEQSEPSLRDTSRALEFERERISTLIGSKRASLNRIDKQRPRLASRALGRDKYRTWKLKHARGEAELRLAEETLQRVDNEAEKLRQRLASTPFKRSELADARRRVEDLRSSVQHDIERWREFAVDESWWTDLTRREIKSLWLDPELCEARAKLFVAAIELHHHFIHHTASELRDGLIAVVDILRGSAPPDLPPAKAQAAWNALFFFVPVVSTTFASFSRMFSHLERESIGWLLIDEAGQTAPQQAVGAIWRSRRTIVVGDPQQLEPVLTIPMRLQKALLSTFCNEDTWIPALGSAQTIADRSNRYGTHLPGEDGPIWVGAPLRIHRRCDNPIFDISNTIAYDGMMISAVPDRPALALPPSCWIDIDGDARGHWIPSQTTEVERILDQLASSGVGPDRVFAITPFRAVAWNLRNTCKSRGVRGGTIHTAQGKEADVVILVLGGDPNRPGAKSWAAQRPNLLNVAVSRARRRLYVIGDRDRWTDHPYFATLGAKLPTVERFELSSQAPWANSVTFEPPTDVTPVDGFLYRSADQTRQRERIREVRSLAAQALPERLSIHSGSIPLDHLRYCFREDYHLLSRTDFSDDAVAAELSWATGVPTGCRHLAMLLTECLALPSAPLPEVDLLLALDWYKVVDDEVDSMQWENTPVGELVNRAKYPGQRSDGGRPEFDELVDRMTFAISRHPALQECDTVVTVPGSSGAGDSFGERLARAVARSSGKRHLNTAGPRRAQRKGNQDTDLRGLFSMETLVHGSCLVIDDVMRSGHSVQEAARAARTAGATAVHVLVATKTRRN